MPELLRWPDKRLRTAAEDVSEITDEIRAHWDTMIEVMEAMPGYGLAAVQLGVMLRLAVVDASSERGRAVRMANPEILSSSQEMREGVEASPNLPGVSARIKRPAKVVVRYLAPTGIIERDEFEGLWAASVQHQIDHLAGRMYFDRLSSVKRSMLLKKATKRGRA